MVQEKNISWWWEVNGFPDTFSILKDAERFIMRNGEFDTPYDVSKVTDKFNRRNPDKKFTRILVKIKKSMVCSICHCVRRVVPSLVTINSRFSNWDDSVIWLSADKSCSNPACHDYRGYLADFQSNYPELKFNHCIQENCSRVAIKDHDCEMHDGPVIETCTPLEFNEFALSKGYRSSKYPILEKLRWWDESDTWIAYDLKREISEYWDEVEDWNQKLWTSAEYAYYSDQMAAELKEVVKASDEDLQKLKELDEDVENGF
jgi:hypothetical protein